MFASHLVTFLSKNTNELVLTEFYFFTCLINRERLRTKTKLRRKSISFRLRLVDHRQLPNLKSFYNFQSTLFNTFFWKYLTNTTSNHRYIFNEGGLIKVLQN
jgi:hypothetical protein